METSHVRWAKILLSPMSIKDAELSGEIPTSYAVTVYKMLHVHLAELHICSTWVASVPIIGAPLQGTYLCPLSFWLTVMWTSNSFVWGTGILNLLSSSSDACVTCVMFSQYTELHPWYHICIRETWIAHFFSVRWLELYECEQSQCCHSATYYNKYWHHI
jgi:hypothetical protein